MIVVDSSVWVDYFNGKINIQTDFLDDMLDQERLVVGDLILAEVLQGFSREDDFNKALVLLGKLEFRPMVGKEVAVLGAVNYRLLREKGVTVRKTIDVLIGTFCMMNGFPSCPVIGTLK